MPKKNYPRWTILSILALLITLVLALCFDKVLWIILVEHVFSGIFVLPHLFNALADIIIPIALVLLLWIIAKANRENKVAPVFYFFVWFLFLILPTIIASFPPEIHFRLPPWLPFDILDTMFHLHFPYSRFHLVSGFALSIGMIGITDRLRRFLFHRQPQVPNRKFPLRTVLSLSALIAAFVFILFLNDLLRWTFDNTTLLRKSFLEFFVIGTLVNTIVPVVVLLLFWSAHKASEESSFASLVFSAIGFLFILLPIATAAFPPLNRIKVLWHLPFHSTHSLISSNAPYSILYYFLGFILAIGIIGISPRIQNFLSQKDTNGRDEDFLTEKE